MEKRWWFPEKQSIIIGYYIGTIENEYGISDYPTSKLHVIENVSTGHRYQFFGSHKIDRILEQITDGEMIGIYYKGKKKLSNGNMMKDWMVKRIKRGIENQ